MVPYKITQSKKGSLPKGVFKGRSGSGMKGTYLPMIATKIPLPVKNTINSNKEKTMKTLQTFLGVSQTQMSKIPVSQARVPLVLNLNDFPVLVHIHTSCKPGGRNV